MKRSFLIAALLLSSAALKAQTVILKSQYLPKHTYKSVMKMGMDVKMGEAAGGMAMKTDMTMNFDAKGGAANASGSFPLTLKYTNAVIKMTMNGSENTTPTNPIVGKTINGIVNKNGKFTVQTIEGGKTDEATKKSIVQIMDQMQEQMKFPDRPIKVGQTITHTAPMSFSGAGGEMNMIVNSTYTLKAIQGDQAFFDFKQNMKMDSKQDKQATGFTGTGSGKVIYSIAQKYPTSLISNMLMKVVAPQGANLDMKIALDMKTAVSGN